jgi:thymidylate synthase (FAD)
MDIEEIVLYGRKHGFSMKAIDDLFSYSDETKNKHGWFSVKFTCDRGVSHEIVRHREASFAQSSTRYCNYSKDKFGNEITVIKPIYLEENMVAYDIWYNSIRQSESAYFAMLNNGCKPEEARAVLENSLMTEIIMTARNYEWQHFFELRTDLAAHPQMIEVANMALNQLSNDFVCGKLFNKYIK